jgi:hypothetical protein
MGKTTMPTTRIKSLVVVLEDNSVVQCEDPKNGWFRKARNYTTRPGTARVVEEWYSCEVRWTEPVPKLDDDG